MIVLRYMRRPIFVLVFVYAVGVIGMALSAFADPVLVYGNPVTSNGAPVSEATIGNIQYELDVYPDAGEFLDGALHVGACFSPDGSTLFVNVQNPGITFAVTGPFVSKRNS